MVAEVPADSQLSMSSAAPDDETDAMRDVSGPKKDGKPINYGPAPEKVDDAEEDWGWGAGRPQAIIRGRLCSDTAAACKIDFRLMLKSCPGVQAASDGCIYFAGGPLPGERQRQITPPTGPARTGRRWQAGGSGKHK